jgi:uncharacterized membrane protein
MHKEMIESTNEAKLHTELKARDKSRLETFIDGVFAMAITLLGLGFVVPLLQHSSGALLVFFCELMAQIPRIFFGLFPVSRLT